MLPTKMANESVLSIHGSVVKDVKSVNMYFSEESREKSFKINPPSTIPPKSETITFLLYSARIMANKEGKRDNAEVSML